MRPQQTSSVVPKILLNTWCWMMMEPGNEACVKQHGHDALVSRLGSEKDMLQWISQSDVIPERYKQQASEELSRVSSH